MLYIHGAQLWKKHLEMEITNKSTDIEQIFSSGDHLYGRTDIDNFSVSSLTYKFNMFSSGFRYKRKRIYSRY